MKLFVVMREPKRYRSALLPILEVERIEHEGEIYLGKQLAPLPNRENLENAGRHLESIMGRLGAKSSSIHLIAK
ncbi:MAG: hypothetical protein S4CHLAM81_09550 [Chlamydiales bacterium]|nr:hypothetical protein [Chlamydiales bacterium]MCH9635733.1 hypothetical protein [Chlamydiales bacterium]MCH9704289.1 hypothetical protein [Chlamydiota bacterium]